MHAHKLNRIGRNGFGPAGRRVVLGCGRWSMGDDQVGLRVAERLRGRLPGNTEVLIEEAPGFAVAQLAGTNCEDLLVIDAAPSDAAHRPGTFAVLEWGDCRLKRRLLPTTTHELDVISGLELLAAREPLPARVRFCLIFGAVFDRSLSLSPPVASAVDAVVEWVLHEYPSRPMGVDDARVGDGR